MASGDRHGVKKRVASLIPPRRLVLLVVFAALVALGFSATRQQLASGNDFPIYLSAAQDLLQGRSPYDVDSGLHGYVYLPFLAIVLVPLSHAPLAVSVWLWHLVGCLAVVLIIHRSRAIIRDQLGHDPPIALELLTVFAIGRFFVDNLALGQVNAIIYCLLLHSVRDLRGPARQALISGGLIGIACAIKPYGAFFLVPLALERRWRAIAAAGLTFVVLTVGLPALVMGPEPATNALADWYTKIVEPTVAGTLQGSKIWDQSPAAGLRRLVVADPAFGDTYVNVANFSQAQFHLLSRALTLLLAGVLLVAWFRSRPREGVSTAHQAAVVSLAMVLLVGYNLKAHFVVLYLPHLYVATRSRLASWRPKGLPVAFWTATAIMILAAPAFVGRDLSNLLYAWSAITVATVLLVVALGLIPSRAGSSPGPRTP